MLRAVVLCFVAVLAALSAASAALTPVPIEGELLVTGYTGAGFYTYLMDGASDAIVSVPGFLDVGDVSPDLSKVAYAVRTNQGPWLADSGEIWVANIDGSGATDLTGSSGLGGVNCIPTWSPDGRVIAFQHASPATGQRTCEAGFQVWLMNPDGTDLHQWLASPDYPTAWPSWEPDGYRLRAAARGLSYITGDVAGADIVQLPEVAGGRQEAWSRDGSRLAYIGVAADTVDGEPGVWRRIMLAGPDGSNPQVLVAQFLKGSDIAAHIAMYGLDTAETDWATVIRGRCGPSFPKWSPLGDKIAFRAALPFDPNGPYCQYQVEVWLYDLATEQLSQLTSNSDYESWHNWAGPNTTSTHPTVTVGGTTVTFSEVGEDGWTSIIRTDDAPALAPVYLPVGSAYEIRTSAVTTGPATVAMTCDTGDLPGAAVGHVDLLRYDDAASEWVDMTHSRDTATGTIEGENEALGLMRLAWPLPESDFSDVSGSESDPFWALWEIQAASDAGIVQGYPGGTYHPTEPVSRAQMAVYIARALAGGDVGVPASPSTVSFPDDVPADHWAYRYVEYAVEAGVVQGYDATHYRPDTIVTRDQMAVFVARAKEWITIGEAMDTAPEVFSDVPAGFWSGTAVEACVAHGVVNGYADGTYHPEREVSRDQMAVYVARAFELL